MIPSPIPLAASCSPHAAFPVCLWGRAKTPAGQAGPFMGQRHRHPGLVL